MRAQLCNSLFESACVSIHTYHIFFPPNKHLTCFTTFHLCGNSFYANPQSQGLVTDHWSKWLGFSALTTATQSSVSGQELKLCFKPLQAKATQDQYQLISQLVFVHILFPVCKEFVILAAPQRLWQRALTQMRGGKNAGGKGNSTSSRSNGKIPGLSKPQVVA